MLAISSQSQAQSHKVSADTILPSLTSRQDIFHLVDSFFGLDYNTCLQKCLPWTMTYDVTNDVIINEYAFPIKCDKLLTTITV